MTVENYNNITNNSDNINYPITVLIGITVLTKIAILGIVVIIGKTGAWRILEDLGHGRKPSIFLEKNPYVPAAARTWWVPRIRGPL